MQQAPKTIERRKAHRQSVKMLAIIKVPGASGISCKVSNINPLGALVEFNGPTILPATFKLIVPEIWFEAECSVKHRSATSVGVQFMSNLREALAHIPAY
ncbi:MAG: hypothetical protein ABL893_16755 [Hyphomicrobium sp.]